MNPQRLDLTYCITWHGRWHVGNGYQSTATDRLQRRLSDGSTPFVPGAQVKGVLRHQCERLALMLDLEAVDPHVADEGHNQRLVDHFRPLQESELLIDRLFGSRYQGECLFVSNAVPTAQERNMTIVEARTAIDRVTGTVMDQHLFTTEVVQADVNLRGEIRARHPRRVLTQDADGFPYEYALLLAGISSVETLGGDKSVGLGRCEVGIDPESLRWNGNEMTLDRALQCFDELEWGDMVNMLREEQGP